MRFNVRRTQIKVVQIGSEFYVKHWGCLEPLIKYPDKSLTLEQIKEIFVPADCVALRLVDPDRSERISGKSGKEDPNYYKGEKDEQGNLRKIQESSSQEGG